MTAGLPPPQDFAIAAPYSLRDSFRLLSMGGGDPCLRFDAAGNIRMAIATPKGPAAFAVSRASDCLTVTPLAGCCEQVWPHLRHLLAVDQTLPTFEQPAKLKRVANKLAGFRLPRLPWLATRLVQIILQQLIAFEDAAAGWRELVRRFGTPVPGQEDLYFPPEAAQIRRLASFEFIECGILPQHGRRIVEAVKRSKRLESTWNHGEGDNAIARTSEWLLKLPGIGPWTVGFLRGTGMGDFDALVPGDYGHPRQVAYFFEGHAEADDALMLRLLEPFRPHRFLVLAMLILGTSRPPRRGPKHARLRSRLR